MTAIAVDKGAKCGLLRKVKRGPSTAWTTTDKRAITSLHAVEIDLGGPVSLEASLECGQAFRWRRVPGSLPGLPDPAIRYSGVMRIACHPVALVACQDANVTRRLTFAWEPALAAAQDVRDAVLKYFSADDDLTAVERELSAADPVMAEAVPFSSGLRVLRQDPWECLASYVLSINNSIPNIARSVEHLARCLGDDAGLGERGFPAAAEIARQDTAYLRQSKCGFRDRNLKDAAEKVASGGVDLEGMCLMPTEQARERLMTIRGVGPKVADCVLLFAYHRLEVFPADVWIARAMSRFYLGGRPATPKAAREEGVRRFGALAGYAQEYLFYRVRSR